MLFKCSVCPEFNFCATCEESEPHDHAFLKYKRPDQKVQSKNYNDKVLDSFKEMATNFKQRLGLGDSSKGWEFLDGK